MWLTTLHVAAAIFATVRLTELIVHDRIAAPLRLRLGYLGTCARCVSVWTGACATCMLFFAPWLNWPLAFAWLYLVVRDMRRARERWMIDRASLEERLGELATERAKTREALGQTQDVLTQQQTHLVRIDGAILELQSMLKVAEERPGA